MKQLIVVDLDGTLVSCNSFHIFADYLRISLLRKRKIKSFLQWCVWGLLRKFHFISHKRLKWQLMNIADRALIAEDYSRIAENVLSHLNPRVFNFIHKKQWILATAASEEYVTEIVKNLDCISYNCSVRPTSKKFDEYCENRGFTKLNSVINSLPYVDYGAIDVVITDHIDDLPLMREAHKVILINPKEKTLKSPEIKHLNYEIWSVE